MLPPAFAKAGATVALNVRLRDLNADAARQNERNASPIWAMGKGVIVKTHKSKCQELNKMSKTRAGAMADIEKGISFLRARSLIISVFKKCWRTAKNRIES